ncbi:MAG: hypothetical protein L0Z48_03190 [candidate division Zixibacteria bacterium]|nr:hypothetical protein [candidate division Zixibacteria bacterium]MCI0595530.1 hypothetical protein [candidate division Zixibacteria bacterium]
MAEPEASAKSGEALPFGGGVKKSGGESFGATVSERAQNFLFAGSSAFLLLAANLFTDYWFFAFFALIPFLYRIIRLNALGAFQLGLFFGLTFLSVYKLPDFLAVPVLTVLTVALGTVLFALFGWAVARAKEKFGFNPLFIALFWVGFELCLLKLSVFSVGAGSPRPLVGEAPYFHGLSALFGFLAVSFVIVLVNSLLVFAIEKTVSLAKARGQGVWGNESVWDPTPIPGLFAQKVYLIPAVRSPPLPSFITST